MINQNTIGWFLIGLGVSIGILGIIKWASKITKYLEARDSINERFQILDAVISVKNGFITFEVHVSNLSNQVIECRIDKNLSYFRVNGQSNNYKSKAFDAPLMSLFPFDNHSLWYDNIPFDLAKNSKPDHIYTLYIEAEVHLKYGKLFKKLDLTLSSKYEGNINIKLNEDKVHTLKHLK
jgi:hypothetical protein